MAVDTLTCTASIEHLDTVISFVEERADRFGLPAQKKFGALVAVEEAFVNVCHYAYPDAPGQAVISCSSDNADFIIDIADAGKPFDVLSLPDPDITSDILDRQVGGLGVHFIRTLTDQVSYRREDGYNILHLVFRHPGVAL